MKPTQRVRLKQLFESRPNVKIPLWPDIANLCIMQYNRVISELKKIEGMDIKNYTEPVDGQKHSYYIYTPCETQKEMFSIDNTGK